MVLMLGLLCGVLYACVGTGDVYAVPIDAEIARIQMYRPDKNLDVILEGEDFVSVVDELKSVPKLAYEQDFSLDFYNYCFTITLTDGKKHHEATYRVYICIYSASALYTDKDEFVTSAKFVISRDNYTGTVDADFMNLLETICQKYAGEQI